MAEQYFTPLGVEKYIKYTQENGRVQRIKFIRCRCVCGKEVVVRQGSVKTGSCGCRRIDSNKSRVKNLKGQKFNRLTAIKRDTNSKWLCLCECGNTLSVITSALRNGNTKSCGCLQKEKASVSMNILLDEHRERVGRPRGFHMSPENKFLRDKFSIEVRPEVLKRDEYKCQLCSNGTMLHVHHIERWTDSPEKRFDLENCITLCRSCHSIAHGGYTRRKPNLKIAKQLSDIVSRKYCAREPLSAGE